PHHQVVVNRNSLLRRARSDEILDDTLGSRRGADGFLCHIRARLIGDAITRYNGEGNHGDNRRGGKGEEEFSIETCADLSKQSASGGGSPCHGAEECGEQQRREEGDGGDDGELRKIHHVAEQRYHWKP